MADSWQQIDDDGVLMDWTSADTIRLCDLWHPLEAVRRAWNERLSISAYGETVLGFDRLEDLSTVNRIPSEESLAAYANWYVNHADHSGDWNLSETEPPSWSIESIEGQIGEALISIDTLDDIYAWLFQQYKIINLFKWARLENMSAKFSETKYTKYKSGIEYWNSTQNGCYNAALSDFSNYWGQGWGSYTGRADVQAPELRFDWIATGDRPEPDLAYIIAEDYPYYMSINRRAITNNTEYDCTLLSYGINSVSETLYTKAWPLKVGMENNKYWLWDDIELAQRASANIDYTHEFIPNQITNPQDAGDPEAPPNWHWSAYFQANCTIAKFDGPNGFKFKDW